MFRDRMDAGRQLAGRLTEYAGRSDVVVLGLLRGGVPVAFEIAQTLRAPLDVLLVRKLGTPGQAELAMGAVASQGVRVLDMRLIQSMGLSNDDIAVAIALEEDELRRREQFYKDVRSKIEVKDNVAIVVDDGIATGSTMLAAVRALRLQSPKNIVVATPVAPPHARVEIEKVADTFTCLQISDHFPAVGAFYRDFSQIDDQEVRGLLMRSTSLLNKR